MDRAQEDQLLQLALAKGLLRPEDLDEALPTLAGWSPAAVEDRLGQLLRSGRLDETAFASLIRAAGGENGEAAATRPAAAAASEMATPPAVLGRYRIDGFLGAGGMGRVYRAYDPTLQRPVALKLLQHEDSASIERFLLEARAQARVDHQHVCKVFEVGELSGRPYIAMQLIAGQPLDEVAPRLSLREQVQIFRQVAEAVHASHLTGLIHRDLKPSNILVERTPEGAWKPYVLDFGIARDMAGPGLTMTGAPVGTPQYMAPEQALGASQRLDGRTDVYGLGATMYAVLTGRPPFEGGNVELLVRLLDEDPPPIHTFAAIPRDVEIVIGKCLDKEVGRRYASAHELALDLQRFLAGEPILARAPTLVDRLVKRAQRNRTATAVTAASLVVLLGLGVYDLREHWRAGQQAELSYRFGAKVQEIESLLRSAHLLPRHDVRREKGAVKARMAEIATEGRRAGSLGDAPLHSALGRGHLSLREYALARTDLEEAWRAGDHQPAVAAALGQAYGALYRQALEEADQLDSVELRQARRRVAAASLRDPALAYLKRSGSIDSSGYGAGLVALYLGQCDRAVAHARVAFAAAPGLYEAKQLEGDALTEEAGERLERGDYVGARAALDQAAAPYGMALEIARSDAELYVAEGRRRLLASELAQKTGEAGGELIAAARAAFAAAAAVDPDSGFLGEQVSRRAPAYEPLLAGARRHRAAGRPRLAAKRALAGRP